MKPSEVTPRGKNTEGLPTPVKPGCPYSIVGNCSFSLYVFFVFKGGPYIYIYVFIYFLFYLFSKGGSLVTY